MKGFLIAIVVFVIFFLEEVSGQQCDMDCGAHGTCTVSGDTQYCFCAELYMGQDCNTKWKYAIPNWYAFFLIYRLLTLVLWAPLVAYVWWLFFTRSHSLSLSLTR